MIGPQHLNHAYFGLYEIARQDELHLLRAFENIYNPRGRINTEDEQQEIKCEQCEEQATCKFDVAGTIHHVCGDSCAKQLWKSLEQKQ